MNYDLWIRCIKTPNLQVVALHHVVYMHLEKGGRQRNEGVEREGGAKWKGKGKRRNKERLLAYTSFY